MTEKYRVSIVKEMKLLEEAFKFRQKSFRKLKIGLDIDEYDKKCHHFLLHEVSTGELVCVFRTLILDGIGEIEESYSAQFYDLSALTPLSGRMLEIGRFCVSENFKDPDILILAWESLARFIIRKKVRTVFGCSSFDGTEPKQHEAEFALLSKDYLSSLTIRPRSNLNKVVNFSRDTLLREYEEDLRTLKFPPLLRFYLRIGAKVSNTAIVDYDLKTIHVFTILTGIESVKYFRKLTLNN